MTDLGHIRISEQDRAFAHDLLSTLPLDDPIGNGSLRRKLAWKEPRYWRIRNTLIAYGLLKTAKGRGGAVMRPAKPSESDAKDDAVSQIGITDIGMDDQHQELAQKLLDKIPTNGKKIGNSRLCSTLRWEKDRYWKIRNTLIAYGLLETGKGKGGSVGRILPPEQDTEDGGKEQDIYPLVKETLFEWAKDQGYTETRDTLIAKTAHYKKGGHWKHPDFVVAGFRVFPYVYGNHIDLFSFEVKRGWADAASVYEAVSHRRFVNYAYLLIAEPNEYVDNTMLQNIAQEQGIGLIVAEDPKKYETWEELVSPQHNDPASPDLNSFIAECVPWPFREKWCRWIEIPCHEDGSSSR